MEKELLQNDKKENIERNLQRIEKIVRYYFSYIEESSKKDLIQEGYIGFLDAIIRFDENKARFNYYSKIRIIGAIKDYIRKTSFLSRQTAENKKRIFKAKQVLEKDSTDNPSIDDIARYLNWPVKKVEEILLAKEYYDFISLDYPVENNEENNIFSNTIPDIKESLLEKIARDDFKKFLNSAIIKKYLSKNELLTIELYFGINNKNPHTTKEISIIFGITRPAVSHRISTAIRKLQHPKIAKIIKDNFL